MNLINNIEMDEGFEGYPYKDTKGILTIGYGTKLPLTKEEGELLLRHRLSLMLADLASEKPIYNSLPEEVKNILANMAYQLGVNGLLGFKKMWSALEKDDYIEASKEMLDSKWARENSNRANRLAYRMRKVK